LQIHDPWLAQSLARDASLNSVRKPFSFLSQAPRSPALQQRKNRSPRSNVKRESSFGAGVQEELPCEDIANLFVADRFRAFLKRTNGRKPAWL
jgi:hypothetical protein